MLVRLVISDSEHDPGMPSPKRPSELERRYVKSGTRLVEEAFR